MTVLEARFVSKQISQLILKKLYSALGIQNDAIWDRFMHSEYRLALENFISNNNVYTLLFYLDNANNTLIAINNPKDLRSTTVSPHLVYFIAKSSQNDDGKHLTEDSFNGSVVCGHVCGEPITSLATLLSHIIIPLIDRNGSSSDLHSNNNAAHHHKKSLLFNLQPIKASLFAEIISKNANHAPLDASTHVILERTIASWTDSIEHALADTKKNCDHNTIVIQEEYTKKSCLVGVCNAWAQRTDFVSSINDALESHAVQAIVSAYKSISIAPQATGNDTADKNNYHDGKKNAYKVIDQFESVQRITQKTGEDARYTSSILKLLCPLFERLNASEDLSSIADCIKLTLHGLWLMWKQYPQWMTPHLMSKLSQAMAEDVATAVVKTVVCQGNNSAPCTAAVFDVLLRGDCIENADRAFSMLRTLGYFKTCYAEYRVETRDQYQWPVISNRGTNSFFDAIVTCCEDVYDIAMTASHYSKLETIEIGGPGEISSSLCRQLFVEFTSIQERLLASVPVSSTGITTNTNTNTNTITNNNNTDRDKAIARWRTDIAQLDARLSMLLVHILESACTIDTSIKIEESFGGLLTRPNIAARLQSTHLQFIQSCMHELHAVKAVFESEKSSLGLFNHPSQNSSLAWIRCLQDRIRIPMTKLQSSFVYNNNNTSILSSHQSTKELTKTYESLMVALQTHESLLMMSGKT